MLDRAGALKEAKSLAAATGIMRGCGLPLGSAPSSGSSPGVAPIGAGTLPRGRAGPPSGLFVAVTAAPAPAQAGWPLFILCALAATARLILCGYLKGTTPGGERRFEEFRRSQGGVADR